MARRPPLPDPDDKVLIPRMMTIPEIQTLYGISRDEVFRLLRDGKLLCFDKGVRGKRLIYDPNWSLSFGATAINYEHVHFFRATEVAAVCGVTTRMVRYWSERRVMGYKLVRRAITAGGNKGYERLYSILNIREALAWRERHKPGRLSPGRKKQREWMVEWAREVLQHPPLHPLRTGTIQTQELYPTIQFPLAMLPKDD